MGKGKGKGKGGHRKSHAPIVRTGVKILLFLDGGRRVVEGVSQNYATAQANLKGTSAFRQGTFILTGYDPANAKGAKNTGSQDGLIGAAEILAGPSGVDMVYSVIPSQIKRVKVNIKGRRSVL